MEFKKVLDFVEENKKEYLQRELENNKNQWRVATEENIDDLLDEWHESDSDLPVYEYLGISREKYAKWVETGKL